jgi:hypothetical protein
MLPVFVPAVWPPASKSQVLHGGRLEEQHFVRMKILAPFVAKRIQNRGLNWRKN